MGKKQQMRKQNNFPNTKIIQNFTFTPISSLEITQGIWQNQTEGDLPATALGVAVQKTAKRGDKETLRRDTPAQQSD